MLNKYFCNSRGGRETEEEEEEELNSPVAHTEDGADSRPSTAGLVETKLEPLEFSRVPPLQQLQLPGPP